MNPINPRSKGAEPVSVPQSAIRHQNSITSWIFDFSEANGVSGWVYGGLFSISFFNSIVFFSQLNEWAPNASNYENIVYTILAYMMMFLQGFAYWDIHRIESHKNHRIYSDWVNRRYEIFLRILILASLLFGVGEVAHILTPIVQWIQVPSVRESLLDFLLIRETRNFAHSLFVKGSIAVFYMLMVWNVCAIIFRLLEYRKLDRPSSSRVLLAFLCTMSFIFAIPFYLQGEVVKGSIVVLFVLMVSIVCAIVFRQRECKNDRKLDGLSLSRESLFAFLCTMSFMFWIQYYHQAEVRHQFGLTILIIFFIAYLTYLVLYFVVKSNVHSVVRARVFSKSELKSWHYRIQEIYERMRLLGSHCMLNCGDIELTVLKNVYAPNHFTDSKWFSRVVSKYVRKGSLLEIGTGTGIIAIKCAMNGASVVATDINPDAVTNTKLNTEKHEVSIDVRCGDVFAPIHDDEKFDYIFWAHPFNNCQYPVSDMLMRSGFDCQYEGVRAYISGARNHLTEKGRLLLGSGESADLQTICDVADQNGYRMICLDEIEMPLATWGDERIRYMLLEFLKT